MTKLPNFESCRIAMIGMGYVGFPLSLEFAKVRNFKKRNKSADNAVIGFDLNDERLRQLSKGIDLGNQASKKEILESNITFTSDKIFLNSAEVFIITVPTPVDSHNIPDLLPLKNASKLIGEVLLEKSKKEMKFSPVIIFESTVYPGATEEVCIPIIENYSKLKLNSHFFCGYSPERVNPGDESHSLKNIIKVTSGSSIESSIWIDKFYKTIITAGTFRASTIKVAEACKVIENTQRDLNIALMNELAMIFKKIGVDTLDVIEAASTKWNFAPYKPGLVGGHCIGIDPYYLAYKAQEVGLIPQMILSGRKVNESVSEYLCNEIIKGISSLNNKNTIVKNRLLFLGVTFKENCPDQRNSKSIELLKLLIEYGLDVDVYDPYLQNDYSYLKNCDCNILDSFPKENNYSAVTIAVGHKEFLDFRNEEFLEIIQKAPLLYDIKGLLPRKFKAWRL